MKKKILLPGTSLYNASSTLLNAVRCAYTGFYPNFFSSDQDRAIFDYLLTEEFTPVARGDGTFYNYESGEHYLLAACLAATIAGLSIEDLIS